MKENQFQSELLEYLVKFGFLENEAFVYLTLLKYGSFGITVQALNKELKSIKRTNIYTILAKLQNSGAISYTQDYQSPNNARRFYTLSPLQYYHKFIQQKKKELENLIGLEEIFRDNLEILYTNQNKYSISDVNCHIAKYISPLLESGWQIKSISQQENVPGLNYSIYEIFLLVPEYHCINEIPFHLFLFNNEIENNSQALEFLLKTIKNEGCKIFESYMQIKEYNLIDRQIKLKGSFYASFSMQVEKRLLKNSVLLPIILKYFNQNSINDLPNFVELGIAIFLPIKNKLFYIWAESIELLEQCIQPILEIENLIKKL